MAERPSMMQRVRDGWALVQTERPTWDDLRSRPGLLAWPVAVVVLLGMLPPLINEVTGSAALAYLLFPLSWLAGASLFLAMWAGEQHRPAAPPPKPAPRKRKR